MLDFVIKENHDEWKQDCKERFTSMKKRAWHTFLLIVLLGCASTPDNGSVSLTATDVPNISIQPSITSQPPLPVPVTETLTQLEINQECIETKSDSQKNSEGILVFQKEYGSRLVFVDNQTGNQKFVPDDANAKVWGAYVSPNGKWLIYELDPGDRSGEHKFILAKADGITQEEMLFGDWNVSSIFWLNNNALRVTQPDNAVTYISNFTLDPFNGAKVPLRSDFPGIEGRGIDWGIDRNAIELGVTKGINIIYDPTLTRVLYPRNDNSVSLFNLETNQEIAKLSAPGRGRLPKWSPDGRQIAIIGTMSDSSKGEILDEFLLVSRDGSDAKRLSFPSSVFKKVHIEDYSWSPDGSRVAFWLKTDNTTSTTAQNPVELAVLDLETNEITNYCISGTTTIEYETYTDLVNILWSPDGTQLLIVRYNNEDNKNTDEVIVDLTNKTAYKVAENMQPIGWMISEQ